MKKNKKKKPRKNKPPFSRLLKGLIFTGLQGSGFLRKSIPFFIFLPFCLGAYYVFNFQPLLGKKWTRKIKNEKPHILQIVETSLLGMSLDIKVLKRKAGDSIYLEFLFRRPDGSFYLINSIDLAGPYNGFLEYQKGTLSLGLLDYDGDGLLEVIAPTFDKWLRPRANIISYNPKIKKFQLLREARFVQFQ